MTTSIDGVGPGTVFYRLRTKRKRERFYRLTRGILSTAPIMTADAPWSIISMVSKNDVQMYLLALKSLYARIKRGKVTAIIDRDMPNESQTILRRHVPGIQFAILEDIDTGRCQRGGTWERVLYLLDRSQAEYAIQLDCDTLSFGDISEVVSSVEAGVPFTLGSSGNPLESMADAAVRARRSKSDHVCMAAERLFDRYPDAGKLRYVSGSSGFAGFAKGGCDREVVQEFHENMARLLGPRWTEWGSEQCASNFAIANSPGAIVLQRPKYGNFNPAIETGEATFLHFYGTYRYEGDFFARRGQSVIAELNGAQNTSANRM